MDGSFACPECGCTVEVRGLTPGRQTRCGFCDRLVEVPFIPRVADPAWRRQKFGRPRWLIASYFGLGALFALVMVIGGYRLLRDRSQAERLRGINDLIRSAEGHRRAGEFGLALVDLDTALGLSRSMGGAVGASRLDEVVNLRRETARRDAESVLARLTGQDRPSGALGGWLSLRARVARDPDLSPLASKIEAQFRDNLEHLVESEYQKARSNIESRKYDHALGILSHLQQNIDLLPPDVADRWRTQINATVSAMIQGPGIVVHVVEGELLDGSESQGYLPGVVATTTRSLRDKGYLPPPESGEFASLWSVAPWRLTLEPNERQEGNYQATRNRLTRIEIHFSLARGDFVVWRGTTIARSRVPVPRIPGELSRQLAISPERIDRLERFLYNDARSLLDERLTATLAELPPCPADAVAAPAPALGLRSLGDEPFRYEVFDEAAYRL
jgi:hypothetical protein